MKSAKWRNDLGQVIRGAKYSSSGTLVPGQDFGYDYDTIGNRKQCSTGVPTCEYSYSANALNQYTQRTIPGVIPVIGEAAPDATVKIHRVNLGEVPEAILTPDRTGKYFSEIIEVDNSSQSVEELLDIYCHKVFNGNEIAEKVSRWAFIPKNPEEFTHDPDGNLLSDGRFTYTYDAENRMISAESNAGIPACRLKIVFSYDYMSRRVEKKIYSWDTDHWSLITAEKYVYDGNLMIAVFDGSDALKESYLFGEDISGSLQATGGIGGLIAVTDSSGTYFPCYDGNGNIVAYINSADGKIAAEYEYDPFGRQIVKSGQKADDFRLRFSTLPYDPELNSTHYLYRDLDHETGRWRTRDPKDEIGFKKLTGIDESSGFEPLYVLVNNDTVNGFDYWGLEWKIKRLSDNNWAQVCRSNSSDTLNDLVGLIGLNPDEAFDNTGWLKGRRGNATFPMTRAQFNNGWRFFWIPNTFVIQVGEDATGGEGIKAGAKKIIGSKGYNVADSLTANMQDVYGVIYIGHFYGGIFSPKNDLNDLIGANHITVNVKHQIAFFAGFGCWTSNHKWGSAVAFPFEEKDPKTLWLTYYFLRPVFFAKIGLSAQPKRSREMEELQKDIGDEGITFEQWLNGIPK